MNPRHKAIRACLLDMSPERAVDYLQSFHLPAEEERYIIEREVHKKGIVQIALEYHTCTRAVNKARASAFAKIADAIAFRNEKSRG